MDTTDKPIETSAEEVIAVISRRLRHIPGNYSGSQESEFRSQNEEASDET